MNVFVQKYILILGFLAFLEVKVLRKALIEMFARSVQIISALDSQTNGGSILGSVNLCKIFRRIFKDRENEQT